MRISPGFVFGMLIGAGLALLFAPGPGEDTRDRLGERTRDVRERVRRYWDD